jgi:hypothetical protein
MECTGIERATKPSARLQYKGSWRRELVTTIMAIPMTSRGGRGYRGTLYGLTACGSWNLSVIRAEEESA